MNLPMQIHAIYTIDITQCYERIPLEGEENIHEALGFIIWKGFSQHNGSAHDHAIWVHINTKSGRADREKWDNKLPRLTCWVEMTYDCIMSL